MEQSSPELALVDAALRGHLQAALFGPADCLAPRPRATADEGPARSAVLPVGRAPTLAHVPSVVPEALSLSPSPSPSPSPEPRPLRETPALQARAATSVAGRAPDAPVFPAGEATPRTQLRVAAHVVVAGILVTAPFVGPVMVDLLGRV